MKSGRLVFRVHAIQRMFQRQVSERDIRHVLRSGEVIERYPDAVPYPSRLMLGWAGSRALHVVAAENEKDRETIVITVYEPDPEIWEADVKRRKQK
jgi:hypothetical protein